MKESKDNRRKLLDMLNWLRTSKIRKIAVAASVIVLIISVSMIIIVRLKHVSAEREYLNNLLEKGYKWEAESTEKYIVVHLGFPENLPDIPTVTVVNLKNDDLVLDGELTISGNSLNYVAIITEGDWKVTSSCAGCVSVFNNLRVEEEDELIYIGQTLSLQDEQEENVMEGVIEGIKGLFE